MTKHIRKILSVITFLSFTLACSSSPRKPASDSVSSENDPFLWLEDIEGKEALEWVKEQNEKTLSHFSKKPIFKTAEKETREILLAKDRIPYIGVAGGLAYNFWRDEKNVRGVWRRTTLDEYSNKTNPKWEVLLDVDQLAETENENWVWKGSSCLPPEFTRCLLTLSRGGKDASVVREYDLSQKKFIVDGFILKEAKSDITWVDQDTVLVGTDFGDGSLTTSGYPRIVKLWKRGEDLSEAKTIYEGNKEHLGSFPFVIKQKGKTFAFISDYKTFFSADNFFIREDGTLIKLDIPDDSEYSGMFGEKLLVSLKSDWKLSRTFKAGSLVSVPFQDGKLDLTQAQAIYTPTDKSSLSGLAVVEDSIYLSILEDVKGKIVRVRSQGSQWKLSDVDLPKMGTTSISSADYWSNTVLYGYENFLVTSSVYLFQGEGRKPKKIKTLPERFRSSDLTIHQYFSESKDGTKIPYFVVHKKDIKLNGKNPTLVWGYGGFEVSYTPFYLGARGKVWLEKGGVFVLANIRGGGEYGPAWHQAALKENRQRAFDDFISVGEDLVARKITSPAHLGIEGGSNGGLLVGTVMMQRPDLYNAIVCGVPLLDMMRYHKLLAGASWMGEYGDPEDPKMREIILKYSPYQNIKSDIQYPRALIYTSTKDDRVHPGHARKMVAKLQSMGHPVWYYENIEGGHSAAANIEQQIQNAALKYSYLFEQLSEGSTLQD